MDYSYHSIGSMINAFEKNVNFHFKLWSSLGYGSFLFHHIYYGMFDVFTNMHDTTLINSCPKTRRLISYSSPSREGLDGGGLVFIIH